VESARGIILCQPDNCKGCSVCCGLFNFRDCSILGLSEFLEAGRYRVRDFTTYEEFRLNAEVRDEFTHICPYQGFLAPGKPGCHIHPLSSGSEGRERSLFSAKICSRFLCPAHSILTAEEKESLVGHINDWYLYSIAIADPESFAYIHSYITQTFGIDPHEETAGILLNEGLNSHAESLTQSSDIIFYYSQPEYILHRENFCIRYNGKNRERVIESIKKKAREAGLIK